MSDYERAGSKRKRSRSPGRYNNNLYSPQYRDRNDTAPRRDRPYNDRNGTNNNNTARWSHKEQIRLNQIQEDERMREWVSQEDEFVVKQAKKKAEIRIKEGRARPIDWLAVTLRSVDTTRNPLDDEIEEEELEFVDPNSVFDGLSESKLEELEKEISTYANLETNRTNKDYWMTMGIICKDRLRKKRFFGPEQRAVSSVAADIDRLLGPKTVDELERLEKQVRAKLNSNEPIDTDYWQQLLDSLLVWKAKAKLKKVYQAVLDARLQKLRQDSAREARKAVEDFPSPSQIRSTPPTYSKSLDPDPSLQITFKDKGLEVTDESTWLKRIAQDRSRVQQMGYVPAPKSSSTSVQSTTIQPPSSLSHNSQQPPPATTSHDEFIHSKTAKTLFDRDVARGVDEDEEIFASEETVEPTTTSTKTPSLTQPNLTGKYRPRKPKYFNRVQMGYEWNKYNQTHYDHDNPPPKVVQGYKFHIFYPDLLDASKAPTYKILREDGRKKGQSTAPAGQEDTCIIRFMSGPPYEDVAFRIVDRDWDYSAKHERGFRSVFEQGVLTLHFSFKKIYYRK